MTSDQSQALKQSNRKPLYKKVIAKSDHQDAILDDNQVISENTNKDDCTDNRITTAADTHTQELAKVLVKEFQELTNTRPHLILANLHRCKLDPNRPIHVAALGDKMAEHVYKQYHNFIIDAKKSIEGPGLLIDLHGQNHHQNSIEIGYLFTKTMLNEKDYGSISPSVKSLVTRKNLLISDFLYGEFSLGAMFESAGYRACPSPRQVCPGADRYYKGAELQRRSLKVLEKRSLWSLLKSGTCIKHPLH